MAVKVGEISADVISLLGLSVASNEPIYFGVSNKRHMQNKHSADFAKYGVFIGDIISNPDYIGINPKDSSIEYVKDFPVDEDFVKVAVRVSRSGLYFARSLYTLNPSRVQNFINNGTLKKC
ncbi:MAG: PBECR2 nuclease fold domain-containing protein [Defluviitaleaceae bacterium]|nr:PBECR2 nuclease fold domain-containing protein [Defluviitaleaceae bacterium]